MSVRKVAREYDSKIKMKWSSNINGNSVCSDLSGSKILQKSKSEYSLEHSLIQNEQFLQTRADVCIEDLGNFNISEIKNKNYWSCPREELEGDLASLTDYVEQLILAHEKTYSKLSSYMNSYNYLRSKYLEFKQVVASLEMANKSKDEQIRINSFYISELENEIERLKSQFDEEYRANKSTVGIMSQSAASSEDSDIITKELNIQTYEKNILLEKVCTLSKSIYQKDEVISKLLSELKTQVAALEKNQAQIDMLKTYNRSLTRTNFDINKTASKGPDLFDLDNENYVRSAKVKRQATFRYEKHKSGYFNFNQGSELLSKFKSTKSLRYLTAELIAKEAICSLKENKLDTNELSQGSSKSSRKINIPNSHPINLVIKARMQRHEPRRAILKKFQKQFEKCLRAQGFRNLSLHRESFTIHSLAKQLLFFNNSPNIKIQSSKHLMHETSSQGTCLGFFLESNSINEVIETEGENIIFKLTKPCNDELPPRFTRMETQADDVSHKKFPLSSLKVAITNEFQLLNELDNGSKNRINQPSILKSEDHSHINRLMTSITNINLTTKSSNHETLNNKSSSNCFTSYQEAKQLYRKFFKKNNIINKGALH